MPATRVLFLINSFVYDGPGALVGDLAPRLGSITRGDRAFHVEVAAVRRDGPLRGALEGLGVPCRALKSTATDPFGVRQVARLLREHAIDVLVTSLVRPDLIGRRAARGLDRVAVVSLEHGPHAWDEKGAVIGRVIRFDYRRTLSRVRRVVAVSGYVRDRLVAERVPPGLVEVIPNGVDTTLFHPPDAAERKAARRAFDIREGQFAVGCAGGLRPIKGQDVLLAAWPAVARAQAQARLLLAGSGELESAGEDASIRILGTVPRERMPLFHRALDLYVQPSRVETFGLALAEAMASGVPCVCTRVGGMVEVMSTACGLMVPADDAAALGAALRELLGAEPEGRRALGEAARARIVERFAIRRVVDQWAALLSTLHDEMLARATS